MGVRAASVLQRLHSCGYAPQKRREVCLLNQPFGNFGRHAQQIKLADAPRILGFFARGTACVARQQNGIALVF
jgi:hypothetical protein